MIERPKVTLADIADFVRFTSPDARLRWAMTGLLCLLPAAIAVAALPDSREFRRQLSTVFGQDAVGLVASLPVGVTCSLLALLAAICINRGWARTEQLREQQVVRNSPDSSAPPDLRGLALLAAILLVLLIPILLAYIDTLSCFQSSYQCLFTKPTPGHTPWLLALDVTIQSLTFSIPQDVLHYPNLSSLAAAGAGGRATLVALRLIVQAVFVGCFFELIRINRTNALVVVDLKKLRKAETFPLSKSARQLGNRLVPRLRSVLASSADDTVVHNIANALRQLRNVSAISTLKKAFAQRQYRYQARRAIIRALQDMAPELNDKIAKGGLSGLWYRWQKLRLHLWCGWHVLLERRRAKRTKQEGLLHALQDLHAATG